MAYDARDGYAVLFSGSGAKNDTWTFSNGTWTELTLSVAPSQRTYAGMTYDMEDHYVLLFGGHHGNSTYLNDTWKFQGGKWTPIAAVNAPPPRAYADMTYDAATTDHCVLLFGGNTSQAFFGDTWTYAAGVWTNITPSTRTPTNSPSARAFSSMAYDTKNGYVVLYGGGSHGEALRDTWKFVDGRWSQLKPAVSPQASYYTMMAFNGPSSSTGRYVLLFGGIANGKAYPYTWEYLLGKWTNISPTTSPPARFGASMAYDAQDGYMVLFGGISQPRPGAPVLDDTWTFANGSWTNRTPLPVHTVTFSESHLPKGSVWSVLADGMTVSSNQSTLRFELSNGAYNYTVDPVTGYTTNSSGTITMAGANLKVTITFEKEKSAGTSAGSASPDLAQGPRGAGTALAPALRPISGTLRPFGSSGT
ncbi:MAG: kelch repeat-containing protein [Thermoplasmata archaeon]